MRALMLVAVMPLFSGCATYGAIGFTDAGDEIYAGEVSANLLTGGGSFKLVGRSTGARCDGVATITQSAMTCRGQKGDVIAQCDDGKTYKGEWVTQSCTTGLGFAEDSAGRRISFKFGLSDDEIKKEIEKFESKRGTEQQIPSAQAET